jgi:hypothetical protein
MTTCVIFDSGVAVETDAEMVGSRLTTVEGRVGVVEGVAVARGVAVEAGRMVAVEGSIIRWTETDSIGGADNWYKS